jgi:hypothetical protein
MRVKQSKGTIFTDSVTTTRDLWSAGNVARERTGQTAFKLLFLKKRQSEDHKIRGGKFRNSTAHSRTRARKSEQWHSCMQHRSPFLRTLTHVEFYSSNTANDDTDYLQIGDIAHGFSLQFIHQRLLKLSHPASEVKKFNCHVTQRYIMVCLPLVPILKQTNIVFTLTTQGPF